MSHIPYQLLPDGYFRWLYKGDQPYHKPFFEDDIRRFRSLPENRHPYQSLSSPESLIEWASQIEAPPPAALIFHVSRCGSTLLGQALAEDEQQIVLPEVPLLDELLRANAGPLLFTSVISLLSKKRTGHETHSWIKLDSWHLFYYEQLRAAFPQVPFILLCREPAPVFASHRRQRGIQAVPGMLPAALFGWQQEEVMHWQQDLYLARLLEKYYRQIHHILQKDAHSTLLHYQPSLRPMLEQLFSCCGITPTDILLEKMVARGAKNAKHPHELFREAPVLEKIPEYLAPAEAAYLQLRIK
ncbi:hypothetical protein [Chitinophaga barathri]|uniref:Sulfotransferase family protein n=1 Tax=Chitinophaga barathri TaxID=1647451 RepID=A0A3N4MKY8_9BACT|nr:hypothetical protein [Chitinophaga barathri]RPD42617.1 hypothetical protein EG028_05470 [Chitinophaga barathri]